MQITVVRIIRGLKPYERTYTHIHITKHKNNAPASKNTHTYACTLTHTFILMYTRSVD